MVIPIILSGGVGSRLWPLSRKDKPKHLMPLIQELDELQELKQFDNIESLSLLQQTILRCNKDFINSNFDNNPFTHNPLMVCDNEHRFLILDQCKNLNIAPDDIIIEPSRRDTAAAILLALLHVRDKYSKDATVLVTPSDHYTSDTSYFIERLAQATQYADQGNIITFGITPTYPETGYGYINADLTSSNCNNSNTGFYNVKRFIEKPKLQVAERLIAEQDCFWNSGMFLFKVDILIDIFSQYQPELFDLCDQTVKTRYKEHEFIKYKSDDFHAINPISIDYAVMQDAQDMIVGKYDGQWADVGCWHGVWKSTDKDLNNNAVVGNVIYDEDVDNCYLRADSRLLVAADVENLSIIETPDAVLVTKLDNSKNLKTIVENSLTQDKNEFVQHSRVHRPWGEYMVLSSEGDYKIKKLMIKPGGATSLQTHVHRSEHWIVLQGTAEVINGDTVSTLAVNESIHIPVEVKHRISNPSKSENLVIIEVQMGEYLSEDDIIRYEDNYGRVK